MMREGVLADVGLATFVSQSRYATIIWSNCWDSRLGYFHRSSHPWPRQPAAERIWDGREGAGPTALPAMLLGEAIALSLPLLAETRGHSEGGGVGRGVDDSSFDPRRACCQKLPGLKRLLATIDCDN